MQANNVIEYNFNKRMKIEEKSRTADETKVVITAVTYEIGKEFLAIMRDCDINYEDPKFADSFSLALELFRHAAHKADDLEHPLNDFLDQTVKNYKERIGK